MKTLGKLTINNDNILKNEELKNLRGGVYNCTVWKDGQQINTYTCDASYSECITMFAGNPYGYVILCN